MNFKRRLELKDKLIALLDEGKGVVICGNSFFYDIFSNFILNELVSGVKASEITDLGLADGIFVEFVNGGRLRVFDVKKEDQLSKFVKDYEDTEVYPLDLLVLIEPVGEQLRDLYNARLLPLLLNRDTARVQVVRAG